MPISNSFHDPAHSQIDIRLITAESRDLVENILLLKNVESHRNISLTPLFFFFLIRANCSHDCVKSKT